MKERREPPRRGGALLAALALGAAAASTVAAQERPYGMPEPPEGAMRDGLRELQERFEAGSPAPGERFPDLTFYDSAGNKVPAREVLRDHTTVVVLGCLT